MAEQEFNHQISQEQYVEGLKAELKAATTKPHREAVKAELDRVLGITEPAPATPATPPAG